MLLSRLSAGRALVIAARRNAFSTAPAASLSPWSEVPLGPPDKILGLTEAYKASSCPHKVNVGVGAYRDESGKPYVLPSVLEAERRVLGSNAHNHEYLPIAGLSSFVSRATQFAYGDAVSASGSSLAAVQSLSGTGSLRLCFDFLRRFRLKEEGAAIYMPSPTWGNHAAVARDAGLVPESYPYYSPSAGWLDFSALLDFVSSPSSCPDGSVFLLHACAHNPTGVDPTPDEWNELSSAMLSRGHVPIFDSAYQGFASGDAETDAYAIRRFVADGHRIALCQSFAKNFGLYGERVGTFSVVCADDQESERVLSQLKILIRPSYSNPPVHGARVVDTILGDEELRAQWRSECAGMADRIRSMREALVRDLEEAGSTLDWSHVTRQIGMFCFTGLTPEQCERMVKEHEVYMTSDGRISMAGLTSSNVGHVARAMHEVTAIA